MEDIITIHQLTGRLVAELKKGGFSETTIWRCYMPHVGTIENYYEKTNQLKYDPAITDEFVQYQKERMKRGEISNYRDYLLAAERLNEVYMTGTISVPKVIHGTKYILNEENGKLLDHFLEWKQYGDNTRDDAIWAVRKYLFHFQLNNKSQTIPITHSVPYRPIYHALSFPVISITSYGQQSCPVATTFPCLSTN